ncbi:MAG TPA: DUF481 domain-containing protein [Terriglobia bacterium]|nr:DUF481 domain-containing protein [Terriglobia bacterium]
MSNRYLLMLLLAVCFPAFGRAEVVHFKNGDHLTGSFVRLEGKTAIFKTDVLGTVKLCLKKINTFTTEKPVVVMLTDGRTEGGIFTITETGEWVLKSAELVTSVEKKGVVAIYPTKIYRPASPEKLHRPWQDWKGKANFGYNLQHSSGHSGALTLGVDGLRLEPPLPGLPPRRRSHFSLNMAFVNATDPVIGVRTSANTLSSDFRQDFFFSRNRHNFVFAEAQWDHIEPQNLQLRQTYGGGYGRDVIQRPSLTLSLRAGTTFVREHFMASAAQQTAGVLLRDSAEGLVGEKFTLSIFKHFDFSHELEFYPSLTSGGNYRFDTVTSISTPISSGLSFQTEFTDHYLSAPLPGTEQNDLVFSMGLGLKF